METNRRAEKRGKVLASLRAEFQALGVQNPILPTDIDCPKRKFERDMFEARQSLRRLESSQKVLGSLLDYLENSSPTIEFDEQQPWTDPATAMLHRTSVNLAEVWVLPT